MLNFEAVLSGAALAMDAFAVSVCTGACLKDKYNLRRAAFRLGLAFGLSQFLMPLIGWLMGDTAGRYIASFAHWIAFIILFLTGSNMILEFFKNKNDKNFISPVSSFKILISVAIATSIDALTVGMGFALAGFPVLYLACAAGIITALMCIAGVYIGRIAGVRIGDRAGLAGGVILIIIGISFLFS